MGLRDVTHETIRFFNFVLYQFWEAKMILLQPMALDFH